ncbi:MAG: hypothetical protein ACYC3X_14350 [Pirellulaceae bacterium]
MIQKKLLVTDRVRRPPREGFSWVDRRFLRLYAPHLTGDAIFLYLFLAAVSDQQGLSFYSDTSIATHLRMREQTVIDAREELLNQDLVAYQHPLTQVLALPQERVARRGFQALVELTRTLEPPLEENP